MNYMTKSDTIAKNLLDELIPYLPASSSDVKDEYEAGEYVAAARGAIHDLGMLRTDVTIQILQDIETLLEQIEAENEPFNLKFLTSMNTGYNQLKSRWILVNGDQSA
ncbi:MAG: hypothetical protein LBK04_02110 [Clostridiales Family XIII bacterium]|jgi:hypothetical protein|nr:hypothetical protein [Clostridiales Family XIII bacterium]